MRWRVILSGDGTAYLVHVIGDSEDTAEKAAREKIRRDHGVERLRVRSTERIPA